MKPSPLSDEELLKYSDAHLRYEIEMLVGVGIEVSQRQFPETDLSATRHKYALVESFVIHFRNLLFFLYPDRTKDNDVTADHFFTDPHEWRRNRPKKVKILQNAQRRAHKEISHLTVLRHDTHESKVWPILELINAIQPILKKFVDKAASKKLHSSVKAAVYAIHNSATNKIDFLPSYVPSSVFQSQRIAHKMGHFRSRLASSKISSGISGS